MSNYIPGAVLFQDLELLDFTRKLQRDPSSYSAYVNQNINSLTEDVFGQKRAAFQKAGEANLRVLRVQNKLRTRCWRNTAVRLEPSKAQLRLEDWVCGAAVRYDTLIGEKI